MKASDIIAKVADKCLDSSFSDEDILALINEARGQIADDYDLPNLITTATVTTTSDANAVALPDDYHKGLFYVSSSNQRRRIGSRIGDYHNIDTLLKLYPNLDTVGQITHAVVDGKNLIYQGQAEDTLTLRYYKLVEDIADTEEPSELPANMHLPILMNYCLREIYDDIEDELEGPKTNTNYYDKRYQVALPKLQMFIAQSTPREPKHLKGIND